MPLSELPGMCGQNSLFIDQAPDGLVDGSIATADAEEACAAVDCRLGQLDRVPAVSIFVNHESVLVG